MRASVGDGERHRRRASVCQHFAVVPPDNKFDLISIVLQVPLGYGPERRAEEGRQGGGCSVNKK